VIHSGDVRFNESMHKAEESSTNTSDENLQVEVDHSSSGSNSLADGSSEGVVEQRARNPY